MGQTEQHKIAKLKETLDQVKSWVGDIERRMKTLEGDNEPDKIAVHAPEPWQKEKVAEVWNANLLHDSILDYPNYDYVFLTGNDLDYGRERDIDIDGYQKVFFEEFCLNNGISDRLDYVKNDNLFTNPKIYKVYKFASLMGIGTGEVWVWDYGKKKIMFSWQPATKKEYEDQQLNNLPFDTSYQGKFGSELGLHEKWNFYADKKIIGAKMMIDAAQQRAKDLYQYYLKEFPNDNYYAWCLTKQKVYDEMINEEIKPPE